MSNIKYDPKLVAENTAAIAAEVHSYPRAMTELMDSDKIDGGFVDLWQLCAAAGLEATRWEQEQLDAGIEEPWHECWPDVVMDVANAILDVNDRTPVRQVIEEAIADLEAKLGARA